MRYYNRTFLVVLIMLFLSFFMIGCDPEEIINIDDDPNDQEEVDEDVIVFEIAGDENMRVFANTEFDDPGVVATLNGEDVSDQVVVSSFLDMTQEGSYIIRYELEINDFSDRLYRSVVVEKDPNSCEFDGTLRIWSFTDEIHLIVEQNYLMDNPDLEFEIEIQIIPMQDYEMTLNQIKDNVCEGPDMIALELGILGEFVYSDYLMEVDTSIVDVSDLANYAKDLAMEGNTLKAVPFDVHPGVYIYNRDLAIEYIGSDDPEVVQGELNDWDSFLEFARQIDQDSNGHTKLVASYDDITTPLLHGSSMPFIDEGEVQYSPEIITLLDLSRTLLDEDLTHQYDMWSGEWFDVMNTDEVFGYFFPFWGIEYVLEPNTFIENWGMIHGPQGYYWGGTWYGVVDGSDMADEAFALIDYLVNNEEFIHQQMGNSHYVPSNMSILYNYDSQPDAFLGNQDKYSIYLDIATSLEVTSNPYQGKANVAMRGFMNDFMYTTGTTEDFMEQFMENLMEIYNSN